MVSDGREQLQNGEGWTIAIKNPSRPGLGPFTVKVPQDATIYDVKVKLSAEYHGNPQPSQQTLIHGGRLLKEHDKTLASIFQQVEQSVHTLHLVVKGEVKTPSATPSAIRIPAGPSRPPATAGSSPPQPQASTSRSQQTDTASRIGQDSRPQSQNSAQEAFVQAGFSGVWPSSQPDPTILAAYNAALESLRSRPPFPSFSQAPGSMAQAGPSLGFMPHASGFMTPQFVPPFSASPCVTPTPHAAHSHSQPAAPQGFTEPSTSQQGSASPPASRQLPQDTHPTSQPAQLYAPTLAYVPVSLVQGSQSQEQPGNGSSETSRQQQDQPQAHPMLPLPPFAGPVMPMMMPFGFNPYASFGPHMMPQLPHPAGPPPPFPYQYHPNAGGPPPVPAGARQEAVPVAGRAAALPGARLARQGLPAVRVRLIRINVKVLLQIAIMAFVIYQSMPRGRFFKILGLGVLVFFLWPILNRNNAVVRTFERLTSFRHPRLHVQGRQQGRGQRAILQEAQALIVGFFASLLPGFNMNAEDAAAFAAAQQAVDQNEGRPHVD